MSVNKGVEMSFKLHFKDGLSFSLPAAFMVVTAARMPVVFLSVLLARVSRVQRGSHLQAPVHPVLLTPTPAPVPSHGYSFPPSRQKASPCPVHCVNSYSSFETHFKGIKTK